MFPFPDIIITATELNDKLYKLQNDDTANPAVIAAQTMQLATMALIGIQYELENINEHLTDRMNRRK